MKIILTGNSNSGKTTLFNTLTNCSEKTGNWHGVTVDIAKYKLNYLNEKFEIIDLPGLSSLEAYSMEEQKSSEYLKSRDYDLLINVIDASALKQSFELTRQLFQLNKPIIIFINFANEFESKGGKLNLSGLQNSLNVKVIFGEATSKNLASEIMSASKKEFPKLINAEINLDKFYSAPTFKMSKIDRILLSKTLSIPFFSLSILAIFYLAFGNHGIGQLLGGFIDFLVLLLKTLVEFILVNLKVNSFISGIICDGIIGGLGSVLAFIPQIAVLSAFLIILEQTGLIARASFALDGFLSKIGLNGRAVFCLLMGFGCTAVALSASNGLENSSIKARLARALPFVSCSSRTPAIMFFAKIAFPNYCFGAIFFAYTLSILLTLIFLLIQKRMDKTKTVPLILEVPTLRKINLTNTLKPLIKSVKEFIIKLGTVVMLVSVFVYLMSHVSTNFTILDDCEIEDCLLAFFGKKLNFMFSFIGLRDWRITTAFISGIFAKEAIISTLYLTSANAISLSFSQGIALIVFTLVYTPCVVALNAIKNELNYLSAIVCAIFQFLLAIVLSYVAFLVIKFLWVSSIVIGIIILSCFIVFIIKIFRKNKFNGNLFGNKTRKNIKTAR